MVLVCLSSALSAAETRRSLSLQDRVRLLEQQLSSANRMRAESQFESTNLKNEVRELRGLVEEQGYQLQQIVNRQRELYRDIDSRRAQPTSDPLGNQQEDPQHQNTSIADADPTAVISTLDAGSIAETATTTVDEGQIRRSYDKIFPLVRSKRYDEAIAEYQQFIAQYPQSIYVSNSRYWLAQVYSVQGRMDEAEREYLSVVQQHTGSSKAPDAWLKLGKLYQGQRQIDKSVHAYNQLIKQYPNSTAAQMAISRLQALQNGE